MYMYSLGQVLRLKSYVCQKDNSEIEGQLHFNLSIKEGIFIVNKHITKNTLYFKQWTET